MEEAVIVLCELGEQRFALSLRVGRKEQRQWRVPQCPWDGGRGGPV